MDYAQNARISQNVTDDRDPRLAGMNPLDLAGFMDASDALRRLSNPYVQATLQNGNQMPSPQADALNAAAQSMYQASPAKPKLTWDQMAPQRRALGAMLPQGPISLSSILMGSK